MAFAHSFAVDFYGDPYDPQKSESPENLSDAIFSMAEDEYLRMCQDLFGREVEVLDVVDLAVDTDTVSSFDAPVEVWIDPDGIYTVLVHDNITESA